MYSEPEERDRKGREKERMDMSRMMQRGGQGEMRGKERSKARLL